ncbi:hypothetical protein PHYPSEUDO_006980 [Phytophthora pseudosyringae]|uniref:Uncharacterized protein n=1 Tax=Phytophthora pseudosyringae TaxID=221518 RepID=A0A8T1VKA1_9STRA|nr:hypothetical protein PHYPSEUDO_006980 [Phytophthora pseudosyringae]
MLTLSADGLDMYQESWSTGPSCSPGVQDYKKTAFAINEHPSLPALHLKKKKDSSAPLMIHGIGITLMSAIGQQASSFLRRILRLGTRWNRRIPTTEAFPTDAVRLQFKREGKFYACGPKLHCSEAQSYGRVKRVG